MVATLIRLCACARARARAADACDGRANVAAASAGLVDPWPLPLGKQKHLSD